jgi:hypothetical protein
MPSALTPLMNRMQLLDVRGIESKRSQNQPASWDFERAKYCSTQPPQMAIDHKAIGTYENETATSFDVSIAEC